MKLPLSRQIQHLFLCFVNVMDDLSAVALILCLSSKIASGILPQWGANLKIFSDIVWHSLQTQSRVTCSNWRLSSSYRRQSRRRRLPSFEANERITDWQRTAVKSDVRYDRLLYSSRDRRGANIFQLDSAASPGRSEAENHAPGATIWTSAARTRCGELNAVNNHSPA